MPYLFIGGPYHGVWKYNIKPYKFIELPIPPKEISYSEAPNKHITIPEETNVCIYKKHDFHYFEYGRKETIIVYVLQGINNVIKALIEGYPK